MQGKKKRERWCGKEREDENKEVEISGKIKGEWQRKKRERHQANDREEERERMKKEQWK